MAEEKRTDLTEKAGKTEEEEHAVAASKKERKAAREEKLRSSKIPQTRRTKGRRGRIRRKIRTPSRSGKGGRRRNGENAKKPGGTPVDPRKRTRSKEDAGNARKPRNTGKRESTTEETT